MFRSGSDTCLFVLPKRIKKFHTTKTKNLVQVLTKLYSLVAICKVRFLRVNCTELTAWFAWALNSPWKSITPLKSPWKLKNLFKSLKSTWIFPSSPWILSKHPWKNKTSLTQRCLAHGKLWKLSKTNFCTKHRVKLYQVRVVISGVDHCWYLTYLRNRAF